MKNRILLFVLVLSSLSVQAQLVWNKKLPATNSATLFSVGYSRSDGDGFLITASNQFLELDWEGSINGKGGLTTAALWLSNYLQKRYEPGSGNPYFLMGWRGASNMPYTLAFYKPNKGGWQPGLTFGIGEMGTFGDRSPAIIELNDTSLLVFTQTSIRKIASPGDSVWIEWEKYFDISLLGFPNAAAQKNAEIAFVTTKGEISVVDLSGVQLWVKTFSNYIFWSINSVSDGYIASGSDINGMAALIKIASDGTLLWEKTFSADLEFSAICTTPDGDIAATGKSVDSNIPLQKISSNGDLIWRKTYQKGNGVSILVTNDEGFFLTAGSSQTGFVALRTTADGETENPDTKGLFREGYLSNGGFALTQAPSSSLFFNNIGTGLHLPADSSTSTIFSMSPWLTGTDAANNLHLSASTYGEVFKSDYTLGVSEGSTEDFNRVWLVTRNQIASLKQDFGADETLDHPIPYDLLTWPAKGNVHFTQNLDFSAVTTNPDAFPAPFVDKNGDGIYNVYDGDYPVLKGDRMLWWTITDQVVHSQTNGKPLNVDLLTSIYAFDCTENQDLYQSIFIDYQIINRSSINYHDAYLGFFSDFDLGCSDDDFIGSLPETNSFYVYNQDAIDGQPGSSCAGGVSTFNDKIPVESITSLNMELRHFMYLNRGGGGPASTNDPSATEEYYNYLLGKWRDGSPLTIGGTGFNPNDPNAISTNFAFPDDPSDPQGWSMCTANLPIGDRRAISAHGPFNFAAGDTFLIQLACVYHPDIPHPCPNISGLVKPRVQKIQQWFDKGSLEKHLDLGSVLTLPTGQSLSLNATQPDPETSYAWSTGEDTPSILVNQPGQYTVTITPASGCSFSETVFVKSSSGLSSPSTLSSWKVQPNPCKAIMHIGFDTVDSPVTAHLRNAQGQIVATKTMNGNSLEIFVGSLPTGFYWVELWNDGKCWGSKKVIVTQ